MGVSVRGGWVLEALSRVRLLLLLLVMLVLVRMIHLPRGLGMVSRGRGMLECPGRSKSGDGRRGDGGHC